MAIALPQVDEVAKPLVFSGISWSEFKTIEPILDRPGIRLSYLDGVLEITEMPGRTHETTKKRAADGYQLSEKSICLPDLNISLLVDCMKMTSHIQSLQQFCQIYNLQRK